MIGNGCIILKILCVHLYWISNHLTSFSCYYLDIFLHPVPLWPSWLSRSPEVSDPTLGMGHIVVNVGLIEYVCGKQYLNLSDAGEAGGFSFVTFL